MLIKEFCTENLTDLAKLDPKEVSRVELCDNLAVGGTTPSYGTIKEAAAYLHEKGIALSTMIRPRGGDFVYNSLELKVMEEDILRAVELESDGLVLGLLTSDHQLDLEGLEYLLPATQGLTLTFHRAFDRIPKNEQFQAMDHLIDLGFHRLLIHGDASDNPISKNSEHLKKLIQHADGRIEIVLAGGVTKENCSHLSQDIKTPYVHGTKIV